VFEGEQVAIDGNNLVEYESLCPDCYFKYKENRKKD
jgi:thymidine kinase